MTKQELATIAETVLRPELDVFGYDRVTIREDVDHENEPSLFVDVFLKAGSPLIKGETSNSAHHALGQSLLGRGEARFPYLRIRYPDGEDNEVGELTAIP